eukprot:scaffold50848_cov36-Prasinocladus_malaysianus.AAC.1
MYIVAIPIAPHIPAAQTCALIGWAYGYEQAGGGPAGALPLIMRAGRAAPDGSYSYDSTSTQAVYAVGWMDGLPPYDYEYAKSYIYIQPPGM